MPKSQDTASTSTILDGTEAAKAIREELIQEIEKYTKAGKRRPGLAVVLIGDNPASQVYVKNKVLSCKKVGIESHLYELPGTISEAEVFALIEKLNRNAGIDGILVQLPLPKSLPTEAILMAVSPDKDADGLHPYNMGLLLSGKKALRPCTPSGILKILDRYNIPLEGKNAVVIGRSNLVGKPIAIMLLERNATVTICHSRSKDLEGIAREADILIVAAGQMEMVRGSWIKPGAVVIDVGIHKVEGETNRLCGDVLYDEASKVASHITPVPGGVGPMTVAMLMSNTVDSYKRKFEDGTEK